MQKPGLEASLIEARLQRRERGGLVGVEIRFLPRREGGPVSCSHLPLPTTPYG